MLIIGYFSVSYFDYLIDNFFARIYFLRGTNMVSLSTRAMSISWAINTLFSSFHIVGISFNNFLAESKVGTVPHTILADLLVFGGHTLFITFVLLVRTAYSNARKLIKIQDSVYSFLGIYLIACLIGLVALLLGLLMGSNNSCAIFRKI